MRVLSHPVRGTARRSLVIPALLLLAAGCGDNTTEPPVSPSSSTNSSADTSTPQSATPQSATPQSATSQSSMPMGNMATPAPEDMVFKDEVSTNTEVPEGLDGLTFVDTTGQRVALQDYIGSKNVILVFTEGFAGMLCPFCKTQTSRLVANYDRFAELETEILVVYPGERDHLEEFVEAARTTGKKQVDQVPFPIVLDPKMTAVDYFDIRSRLAHPSTYVIDKLGNVRLAYVGADMSADRPSIQALLDTLKATDGEGSE